MVPVRTPQPTPANRPEPCDELELMRRVAAGDRRAFHSLYRLHAKVVRVALARHVRRYDVAEELLQEVFLQAWTRASRYRPERAGPRGWLLVLARSRALDYLRSNNARVRREERAQREILGFEPQPARGTGELERKESSTRLRQAMQQLSPQQKRCIELAFWEELSHRQIAERLGQPLGTVKSRILLGMRRVRRQLEKELAA